MVEGGWKDGGRMVEGGRSRAVICLCASTCLATCKSGMIPCKSYKNGAAVYIPGVTDASC